MTWRGRDDVERKQHPSNRRHLIMADQHRMPTHHPRIYRHSITWSRQPIISRAQTGFEILEAGGNAIDAGVAAGIALGVLQCEYVHFGGVAPIMIHLAETGQTVSISGLGPWPKLASAAWFREHQGGRILSNIKRCVIPAAPDRWITALDYYGTHVVSVEVAATAIRLGREGFGAQSISAEIIGESVASISHWPQNAAIYLPNGKPPLPGQRFFQTDLANSHPVYGGSGFSPHSKRRRVLRECSRAGSCLGP